MIEQAAMFTPEQVNGFLNVLGALILVNAGSIITTVFGFFLKNIKLRRDLNEAFRRIRKLEQQQSQQGSDQ